AAECAAAMVAWLREDGVGVVRAAIHPDHAASEAVARRLGLAPTDERVDGEVRWELRAG
ncbi:GNAT family N-acetyltransferase, partial [Clavibacter phaseoli]